MKLKPGKLLISVFVGVDVLVVCYWWLAQLRVALFGQGEIPGGGSAFDMAIFLLPLFLGWVAGDRLYYFLTYKERRAARSSQVMSHEQPDDKDKAEDSAVVAGSVWEDRGWDDSKQSRE
jgi:hypothetical protein